MAIVRSLAYISLPYVVLRTLSQHSPVMRYYVRLGVYLSTLGIASAWGAVVSVVLTMAGRRFDINYVVARSFYWMCRNALGIRFVIEGEENLKTSPAVLIGNHQSMLDIAYLGRVLPPSSSILAKKELQWMPILGQFMSLSGAIFVDRGNNKQAVQSLATAARTMKERRTSLWIFPEGTRTSSEEPSLKSFKKGAFHLAQQGGIPVVPVVCENYWRLYRKGVFETGTLRIRVLTPVATTGLKPEDVPDLVNRVHDQMLTALREISSPNVKGGDLAAKLSSAQVPPPAEQGKQDNASSDSPVHSESAASLIDVREIRIDGQATRESDVDTLSNAETEESVDWEGARQAA